MKSTSSPNSLYTAPADLAGWRECRFALVETNAVLAWLHNAAAPRCAVTLTAMAGFSPVNHLDTRGRTGMSQVTGPGHTAMIRFD
jgi:hypothetical protein